MCVVVAQRSETDLNGDRAITIDQAVDTRWHKRNGRDGQWGQYFLHASGWQREVVLTAGDEKKLRGRGIKVFHR
jgi:phage anti-repressor protein